MIPAVAIFLLATLSLADAIAWAIVRRRIRREREAWPPRRVITTRNTLEETF